ncbi:MAG: Hpt domain-containing protein [Noviherbaspirillum sp.]
MENPPAYRCCQPWLLLEALDSERGVFLELAQIFRTETLDRYADIARACATGAVRDMGFEAHSLKGTVGAVGAAGLVQLLQQIEDDGLKHARPCSAAQLAQLAQLLQFARADMDAFTASL